MKKNVLQRSGIMRRMVTMSPWELSRRLSHRVINKLEFISNSLRRKLRPIKIKGDQPLLLHGVMVKSTPDFSTQNKEKLKYIVGKNLDHYFHILGSGWVSFAYDSTAVGVNDSSYSMNLPLTQFDSGGEWIKPLLRRAHLKRAQKIWQQIDEDYRPLDWQKDVKSGYRWSEKNWIRNALENLPEGVDVKVPWEFARFQHQIQLAIAANVLPDKKQKLLREFRNQILDFIALNPPGLGINWVCPMDVAIRATNLLYARELFMLQDKELILDAAFQRIFSQSMEEHGRFIVENLEYYQIPQNHYLANVCGLLFIAASSKSSPEKDRWLAFSVQEIVAQCRLQFYADGGNFEGSTSYHRLSLEMLLWSTALITGLEYDKRRALKNYTVSEQLPRLLPADSLPINYDTEQIFPIWFLERIFRAAKLTELLTDATGHVPTIGDQDSGRFLPVTYTSRWLRQEVVKEEFLSGAPCEDSMILLEDTGNHSGVISINEAMFGLDFSKTGGKEFALEYSLISGLIEGKKLPIPLLLRDNFKKEQLPWILKTKITPIDATKTLQSNTPWVEFSRSGYLIYCSERIQLVANCIPNGMRGYGGHNHNDKLSFTLMLDQIEIAVDPGTYLYTPVPSLRNHYRSAAVHTCPQGEKYSQNSWRPGRGGLFHLFDDCVVEIVSVNEHSILLKMAMGELFHLREFRINVGEIEIIDYSTHQFDFTLPEEQTISRTYGQLERWKMPENICQITQKWIAQP